jgi:hypothetical protein
MTTVPLDQHGICTPRFSRVKKFQIGLWAIALFILIHMEKDLIFQRGVPEDEDVKYKNGTAILAQQHLSSQTQPMTAKPPAPTVPPPPTKKATVPFPTQPPIKQPVSSSSRPLSSRVPATDNAQHPMDPSSFTIKRQQPEHATVGVGGETEDETVLPAQAQRFVDDHCDLTPLKSWYPSPELSWQQRAPYVIVAGVWNSGISFLQTALHQHPQILPNARKGVTGFFLPKNFYSYQSSKHKTKTNGGTGGTNANANTNKNGRDEEDDRRVTKVFAARQRMYAQVYASTTKVLKQPGHNYSIAMDVSPGYLFYANQVSQAIQCVAPWSKTIIVLRNPVDRVYEQWVYGRTKLGLRLSLKDWMAQDIKAMTSVGLDKATTRTSRSASAAASSSSKEEERRAWKQYQAVRNLAGAIGRSLYVLQLQEWFDTLKDAGKDPKEHVFLLSSEQWERQPHQEYAKVVDFLGLAPHVPSTIKTPPRANTNTNSLPPMTNETRQMLEEYFAPYNARLSELLVTQHGFGEGWKDLWKPTGSS